MPIAICIFPEGLRFRALGARIGPASAWTCLAFLLLFGIAARLPAQTGQFPIVYPFGVVNGASFTPRTPIAAGSIVSIFGQNLASSSMTAQSLPLPTTLGGTTVRAGSYAAPLFFISPTQINFQMPFEVDGQSQVSVLVISGGIGSGAQSVQLSLQAPGIFSAVVNNVRLGAILNSDYTSSQAAGTFPSVTSRPAFQGEVIQIFCTGLGKVNNFAVSGAGAPLPDNTQDLSKANTSTPTYPTV